MVFRKEEKPGRIKLKLNGRGGEVLLFRTDIRGEMKRRLQEGYKIWSGRENFRVSTKALYEGVGIPKIMNGQ